MPQSDTAEPLWVPDAERRDWSRLGRALGALGFDGYQSMWEWSVDPASRGAFWRRVADQFGVAWLSEPVADVVDDPAAVTGVRWFPGGRLNYAERCLRVPPGRDDAVAVVARSETRPDWELTWRDLRALVARVRAGLSAAGVGEGDRVAGYLPNIPEALAVLLASASLGAVWCCCAPEMGADGCLDRLGQVEPTVLVAVDGYRYSGKELDRSEEAKAIRAGLPSVRTAVWVPYLRPEREAPAGWTPWAELVSREGPVEFAPVGFDHPLYVLFSSGTTGRPKAIVHGHGGILLEHVKALGWHFDLGEADRFFWFATTGWMMWNFCVSGLAVDATVVLYDGDPSGPQGDLLWGLMSSLGVTCGGVGAAYLVAGMKAGHRPGADHDLSRLRTLGSTGSALPAPAGRWVYERVKTDLMLGSFSGGTDVCSGFVGPSPLHPVYAGEISCRCLGARVEVLGDQGRPVTDAEGELVLTGPLPSMPVGIWGDDGSRYRSTYFHWLPGVWVHGDRATLTSRGTLVITGRSDGTLNRGGVRMGTAELYSVVESLDQVADSLAVHLEDPEGGPGRLLLFVVGRPGAEPEQLAGRIRAEVRGRLSPRHVPDEVLLVDAIPRTLTGKKLEVPVKRILSGVSPSDAVAASAVADPESLRPFIDLARQLLSTGPRR